MTPVYYQPITWVRDPVTKELYKKCRGRDRVGPQPIIKTARFTGFEAFADSRPPVIDPGTGNPRADLVPGTYKPTKDNTGHITPVDLLSDYNATSSTTVVLSTANMTISGKRIYGHVQRNANNITISDCLLRGPAVKPSTEISVVRCFDTSFVNTQLIDCTIAPMFPNPNMDGIKGSEYTALRCHVVWCVDGFGIYTAVGSTRATNTRILACKVEALVYYHGGKYSSGGGNYWNGTSYGAVASGVARPSDVWTDAGHNDGNHSDGTQVQGAMGAMTRVSNTSDELWTGNGVWIHGNTFNTYDATHDMADPTNSNLIVPGQAGSFAGSKLGTQDSPRRKDQLPSDVPPVLTTTHKQAGFWPNNGACFALTPNATVVEFQGESNKWSLVVTRNYFDNYNIAANIQKSGRASVGLALLNNYVGPHVYTFSNGTNYVFRIYTGGTIVNGDATDPVAKASIKFATKWDGTDGLATNRWDDPGSVLGVDGESLVVNTHGGIVYS